MEINLMVYGHKLLTICFILSCHFALPVSAQVKGCFQVFTQSLEIEFKAKNHYQRLGVLVTAGDAEIKRAYRLLAKVYHPDRHTGGNEEVFKLVKEAYETLMDPAKKATYDLYSNFDGRTSDLDPNSEAGRASNANADPAMSARENFISEFVADQQKLKEPFRSVAMVILPLYAKDRETLGPVQAFTKLLKRWTNPTDRWERSEPVEFTNFLIKYFYKDFQANSPTTAERFEMLKILMQRTSEYHELRDELFLTIATKAENIKEAIEYSILAKGFHLGSGLRTSDLYQHLRSKFILSKSEFSWLMAFFTIRSNINEGNRIAIFKDVFAMLNSEGNAEALATLMKLRSSYQWSRELQNELESMVYSLISRIPETLSQLESQASPYAKDAKAIFTAGREQKARLDRAFGMMREP